MISEGWVARINASSQIINDLKQISQITQEGNSHIRDFDIFVTTNDSTAAESLVEVNIKVEDKDSGIIVDVIPIVVKVGPSIGAELSPQLKLLISIRCLVKRHLLESS